MIYLAALFYMVLPTEGLSYVDRIVYGEWPGKSGDKLTQFLNLLAIGSSVILFWWGTRRRSSRFNRALPLAAAGLFLISILWSVTPSTTLTRSVAYFFLIIGAIGMVETFDPDQIMRLTALIGGFSAAISLVLPDPDIAFTGGFRGAFPGKNQLGAAMAVGVLGGLHGIRVRGWRGCIDIGVTILCTTVAFLSKSGTSLLTIFTFFTLHIIGTFYVKGGISRIVGICLTIFAIAAFVLVMMNIDLIYSLMDKDPTLTGRTDIWPYVIDYIYQKPLLGWGFAAFFYNPSAVAFFSKIGFGINEAHNGLLQLLLDVGVVGTALFLFLWTRNVVIAVKCISGPAPAIGVSSLALLIGILLMGVTEQVLTTADGLTAQFFLLGFVCEKQVWLARRAKSAMALRSTALHLGQLGIPQGSDAAQ